MIEEFGALDCSRAPKCARRPPLTISDVRRMAQISFGMPNFNVSYPPCADGGEMVACKYDSGHCCRRPQAEFIGLADEAEEDP